MEPTFLKVSGALAVAVLAGCAGNPSLAGRWVNETKVGDIGPGNLTVVLREDGNGALHFDQERYVWFWTDFRYRTDEDMLVILPVYPENAGTLMTSESVEYPFELTDDRIRLWPGDTEMVFRRIVTP